MLAEIEKESKIIIKELFEKIEEKAKIKEGSLLVVGCSTSEVIGGNIGKNSSEDVAKAIYNGIKEELEKRRVNLAAQCCEHLNRCLVVEKSVAEKMGYEQMRPKRVITSKVSKSITDKYSLSVLRYHVPP